MKHFLAVVCAFPLLLFGCKPSEKEVGIWVQPMCMVDGNELVTDTLCYVNAAGNRYQISDVQWFISNVEIRNVKGEWLPLDGKQNVHYAENAGIERFGWDVSVPVSKYEKLRFTFGLNATDNITGRFVNQPEANMFWPDMLGGGYHHMKLNGKWLNAEGVLEPFAVHLGTGQNAGRTEFYDNSFVVELPVGFDLRNESALFINMNIEEWFSNPNEYDFNVWGGSIMQNQAAQQTLKENGLSVFEVKIM